MNVGILVVSDSRSAGTAVDAATPRIRQVLRAAGCHVVANAVVPDDVQAIRNALVNLADEQRVPLVLTTGGTGLGLRDVTPEATADVIERAVPGLPEAMRSSTAVDNPHAWLSRSVAGVRGGTLIVNLPGSPKGAEECLHVLLPLLPHALEMMKGHAHDLRVPQHH